MGGAAVVAADDAGDAPHPAADDVVIQGVVGTTDGAAQQILNGLVAETHHRGGLAGRNHHRGFAVGEVVDGLPHHLPGHIQGMMFIKGDVHGGPFDHGPVVRGDQLGVITFGNIGQGLHFALHVHHHGVHGAGDHGQFLLQVVARHRNAVAHQDFVGGAAHAGQLDALGALVLGILDHLRFLGGHIDHLRQQGLMAVHDDIDVIFFQDAQVDLTGHRHRHAEHDVLQIGGDHGAAPAVGQGAAGALLDDVVVFLVHAHVGAVHQFHDLDVAAPGHHALLPPDLLAFLGGPLDVVEFAFLLAEHLQDLVGHFLGNGFHAPGFLVVALTLADGYVPVLGDFFQFGHVFNLISLGLAVGHFLEEQGHATGVVVVGGSSGRHHAGKIPGGNGLGGGAAQTHPALGLFAHLLRFGHPAGTLGANLTTGAFGADGAGLHGQVAVEYGFDTFGLGLLQQFYGYWIYRSSFGIQFFLLCHVTSS